MKRERKSKRKLSSFIYVKYVTDKVDLMKWYLPELLKCYGIARHVTHV